MPKTSIPGCLKALERLDAALREKQKPKPQGWFSVHDIMAERGVKGAQARNIIRNMVDLGIVERDVWQNGSIRVPIYRVR